MIVNASVNDLLEFFMLIIPVVGLFRIIFCLTIMSTGNEESKNFGLRIKNILLFLVLSECVLGIINLVLLYFGGE